MQNEEEMDLFFGLTKTDLTNLGEVFVLIASAVFITSIAVVFIAFVLDRLFERKLDRLGLLAFVLGIASYIPVFGLMYGVSGIVWGLLTEKKHGKVLAWFCAGGILFTVLLAATPFLLFW